MGVGQHLALEVNWPTATRGYSALVLDNGGAGFSVGTTVNFTYAAATDVARRLDLELAARPGYLRSAAFEQSRTRAERDLTAAQHARSEAARGRLGQLALNELAVANDLLLTEYGVQFARSHAASSPPWLGLTMDRISHYQSDLARARRLTGPYGWMRFVFDRGEPPSHYLSAVRQAKALGIHVLGQPIDSAYAHFYDRRGYLAREAGYIDYFRSHGNLVDAWEVGNEVNGEWLGPQMGAKVADSAAYARAHSSALVVVTLFWQLGTASTPINATFNWAQRYLPPAVQRNVDVVLLSTYPDGAPMGLALDQVLRTMYAALPSERIGIGELGYYPGPGEGPGGTAPGPPGSRPEPASPISSTGRRSGTPTASTESSGGTSRRTSRASLSSTTWCPPCGQPCAADRCRTPRRVGGAGRVAEVPDPSSARTGAAVRADNGRYVK